MRRREEAILERLILRDLGLTPDLMLCTNEVGEGHPGSVRRILEEALGKALSRYPSARTIAVNVLHDVLNKNRITWGLGVGSPDLVGCVGGRFIGLELKSETGRVRPEQGDWHEGARRSGALIEVVRSVDEARAVVEKARRA